MTGIRFIVTSYMHVWLYKHINILDELYLHGYNILQQILVISFVSCFQLFDKPNKDMLCIGILDLLSVLISIEFMQFFKNVENLGERDFNKAIFLHIFHGVLAKSTGYKLVKIAINSIENNEENDNNGFLNGVFLDGFNLRVIKVDEIISNESDNEALDEQSFLRDIVINSQSPISEEECNGNLEEMAKILFDNVTRHCDDQNTQTKTKLELFLLDKHSCATLNKFKHSLLTKNVNGKENKKYYAKKHRRIFEHYIYGGLNFLCKTNNMYNITNKNFTKMQQLGINIFEILFNTTSINLKRFCDFPRKHHKNKCDVDLDNELFYGTYGFKICLDGNHRTFFATWPVFSIVYSEFMQKNNTNIIEIFSGENYPYLSDASIEMLYKFVAYDEYTVYHRRNVKYQSIIKHLREARQMLVSPFILDSIFLTAIQAHKMFSGNCRFFHKSVEYGSTMVDCDKKQSNEEYKDKNIFYVFVEYYICSTIIVIILLFIGFFINIYFAVLLNDCWKKLNNENKILMTSLVLAYLIFLIVKLFHYLRPYFYNDFMEKNFIKHTETYPGISMVNKTYSLLTWTILYTFKETGILIAIEETIFRSMNKLTCIIGFVIMINTFADMLFRIKNKHEQKSISYYKLSSTLIVSYLLGICILVLVVVSSIFTYNSMDGISEIVHKMQVEKFAYLKICKYSNTFNEGKKGMNMYSWTSFIFVIFYTLLTILFLLYYKLEQKTTNIELTFSNIKNLKATVYSLVGGYITYIIANGYLDYKNILYLMGSKDGKNDYDRTFEMAEHTMFYQIFSILLLINPIVQPILIILRLTEMKKQHCIYWSRFWEIGLSENITNMLWYPITKIYLFFKYLNCRKCHSNIKNKKIKKNHNIVVMEKKFPKYPTFTTSLKKNIQNTLCLKCKMDGIDTCICF
uniref:G-protein coupled receptors family 1 profile domain-containing protein n=1 Tax=Strongyloides stercoralis TaxID=6248 RepID=A0AAF5DP46_STRER